MTGPLKLNSEEIADVKAALSYYAHHGLSDAPRAAQRLGRLFDRFADHVTRTPETYGGRGLKAVWIDELPLGTGKARTYGLLPHQVAAVESWQERFADDLASRIRDDLNRAAEAGLDVKRVLASALLGAD